MTGFDPTAPDRDVDKDEPTPFPDNVVPPEALLDDEAAANAAADAQDDDNTDGTTETD